LGCTRGSCRKPCERIVISQKAIKAAATLDGRMGGGAGRAQSSAVYKQNDKEVGSTRDVPMIRLDVKACHLRASPWQSTMSKGLVLVRCGLCHSQSALVGLKELFLLHFILFHHFQCFRRFFSRDRAAARVNLQRPSTSSKVAASEDNPSDN
jgi:hypothetical protein